MMESNEIITKVMVEMKGIHGFCNEFEKCTGGPPEKLFGYVGNIENIILDHYGFPKDEEYWGWRDEAHGILFEFTDGEITLDETLHRLQEFADEYKLKGHEIKILRYFA